MSHRRSLLSFLILILITNGLSCDDEPGELGKKHILGLVGMRRVFLLNNLLSSTLNSRPQYIVPTMNVLPYLVMGSEH